MLTSHFDPAPTYIPFWRHDSVYVRSESPVCPVISESSTVRPPFWLVGHHWVEPGAALVDR